MTMDSQKKYGIIGHPIGHSLSPLLYTTAFRLCGLSHTYESFDLEPSGLAVEFRRLVDNDYSGFNVTIPHKETIMKSLSEVSSEAKALGAVNTIVELGRKSVGYNTDAYGFAKLMDPYRPRIEGNKILVLGAGGASRALVFALQQDFRAAAIVMASRSPERGALLARSFPSLPIRVIDFSFKQLRAATRTCSVIINSTPVGMDPDVTETPLPREVGISVDHLVVDLIYTPLETTLMRDARSAGATTAGGIEMFLHQGAKAFEIWTGMKMPLEEVRKVVVKRLQGGRGAGVQG